LKETAPAAPARLASSRLGNIAVIAGLTLVSFLNALAVASRLAQTSDSANGLVAGGAIAGSNVLLSGWHFPIDDYYFTDAIPYGLAEWLCGHQPFLLVLIPALTYALFVFAALLVCIERDRPPPRNVVSCAVIALLLGAPSWTGQWNALLLSDMHMATVFCAFLGLLLCVCVAGATNMSFVVVAGLVTVTGATVASDPFAIVFAFGPALAILAVAAVSGHGSNSFWRAFLLLGTGTLAGLLLPVLIAQSGGFTIENDVLTRAEALSLLPRNMVAVATGVLTLFGANPFAAAFGPRGALLFAVRGTGLVVAVAAVLHTLRHVFMRNQTMLLDRMLCAGTLTVVAACALSAQFAKGITPENLWTGGPPMRFLVPAYLFVAVLAGRQAPEMLSDLPGVWVRNVVVAGAAIVMVGGYWLAGLDGRPLWIADNPPAAAARWLKKHVLFQGVGEYWSANLITAMSGNVVRVRSVVPESGRLVPYIWAQDVRGYAQSPQFVIWQDNNKTHVTADAVRATYPVGRIVTVSGYRIALLATGPLRP
jgi:hypothetical protein